MEKTQDDEAINKLWECFTSFVFFLTTILLKPILTMLLLDT